MWLAPDTTSIELYQLTLFQQNCIYRSLCKNGCLEVNQLPLLKN